MNAISERINQIQIDVQGLRSRISELESLLPGLREALKISDKSPIFPSIVESIKTPDVKVTDIDKMRRGTKLVKMLQILNSAGKPMQSQEVANLMGLAKSKPVRTLMHIAKGKQLVSPAGDRAYIVTDLGKELLNKEAA